MPDLHELAAAWSPPSLRLDQEDRVHFDRMKRTAEASGGMAAVPGWSAHVGQGVLEHPLLPHDAKQSAIAFREAARGLYGYLVWSHDEKVKNALASALLPSDGVRGWLAEHSELDQLAQLRTFPMYFNEALEAQFYDTEIQSAADVAAMHYLDRNAVRLARDYPEDVAVPWAARHEAFRSAQPGSLTRVQDGMAAFLFRLDHLKQSEKAAGASPLLALLFEIVTRAAQEESGLDDALQAAWQVRNEVPDLKLFGGPGALPQDRPPTFADLLEALKEQHPAVHDQLLGAADTAWDNVLRQWRRDQAQSSIDVAQSRSGSA